MISLGCAKNKVDSEEILSYFVRNGFVIVTDPTAADMLVVNTCGFIEAAKKEAIETIFNTLKYHKITVVIGCLVERYLDDLKKSIPEVDLFVPIREYSHLGELLAPIINNVKLEGTIDKTKRVFSTPSYQAYLQISDGCNNFCSFCAIPLIRGRFHSFSFDTLCQEIKDLATSKVKEIVVISQDTSIYGADFKDKKINICTILKEILKYQTFEFIRLLYLYPDEITDEFIQLFKNNPRLTPYFDVPIQHCSDKILKAMHRHGTKADLEALFSTLRREVPNAIVRTTLIVGFPGETEEDIKELNCFIQENEFDHLGVFKYSREEGTLSYNFADQVPEKTKTARYNLIMKTQAKVSFKRNQKHVGEIVEAIVTGYDAKNYSYAGICYIFAPDDIDGRLYIYSSKRELSIGETVKVKIINAGIYDLDAEVIEN